ncbi:MAG: RNA-binding protein [Bacteroidia bacterium]|nr:RNA-binding protein [Bacteroidia bacterium]
MKITVSNLNLSVDQEDLLALFVEFGEVERIQIFSSSKKNRIAFIEMANILDALEAVQELDGELYMGRPISVSVEKVNVFIKDSIQPTLGYWEFRDEYDYEEGPDDNDEEYSDYEDGYENNGGKFKKIRNRGSSSYADIE